MRNVIVLIVRNSDGNILEIKIPDTSDRTARRRLLNIRKNFAGMKVLRVYRVTLYD